MATKDQTSPDLDDTNDEPGDEISDFIREQLEANPGEDDGADEGTDYSKPLPETEDGDRETVSQAEGQDLASDAQIDGPKKAKGAAKTKAEGDKAEGEDDEQAADAEDQAAKAKTDDTPADDDKAKDTTDFATTQIDALIDGLPDDRRAEVSRRLDGAAKVLAPFASHKAELDRHGTTPEAAMNRLIELNTFAQTKPDEYLAWVATQVGNDPKAVLEKAAGLLGMKLTAAVVDDDDDDDPFGDPELIAAKARIKELEAGQQANTEFGPDTPQIQAQRQTQHDLATFISAVDAEGKPLRPYFDILQPHITQMSRDHLATTQTPVTVADLDRFYNDALGRVQTTFSPNPAAQTTDPVQTEIQKKTAAATKARLASKSIDGSGPGGTRQPALSADADIKDVVRHAIAAQSG